MSAPEGGTSIGDTNSYDASAVAMDHQNAGRKASSTLDPEAETDKKSAKAPMPNGRGGKAKGVGSCQGSKEDSSIPEDDQRSQDSAERGTAWHGTLMHSVTISSSEVPSVPSTPLGGCTVIDSAASSGRRDDAMLRETAAANTYEALGTESDRSSAVGPLCDECNAKCSQSMPF